MKIRIRTIMLASITAALLMSSCGEDNPLDVDISGIEVDLQVQRFEQDLFALPMDNAGPHIAMMQEKYGNFFRVFAEKILRIGPPEDPGFEDYLKAFVTDYTMSEVYDEVQKQYSDIGWLIDELELAFRHYKYYYPDSTVPIITTYMSGFNYSNVVTDKRLVINLERYLGADCPFYSSLQLPVYMRERMRKDMITPDCIYALGATLYPFAGEKDDLISQMLYTGKVMYFVDAMLPGMDGHRKMGYTEEQLEWCRASEEDMWRFLVDQKLLFSTDHMVKRNFTGQAGFTKAFSKESPPQTGIWLGLQVIRSYMENNQLSLPELMQNNNYHQILNLSQYKPGD